MGGIGTGPRRGGITPALAGVEETEQEKAVAAAVEGGADTTEKLHEAVGADVAKVGVALLQRRGRITGRGEAGIGHYRIIPKAE